MGDKSPRRGGPFRGPKHRFDVLPPFTKKTKKEDMVKKISGRSVEAFPIKAYLQLEHFVDVLDEEVIE